MRVIDLAAHEVPSCVDGCLGGCTAATEWIHNQRAGQRCHIHEQLEQRHRLLRRVDHVERGSLKTDNIGYVVLDEGDQMLDMGFREELEGILNAMPAERRTWLFSATMPPEVKELSKRYLKNPLTISLVQDGDQHEDIVQGLTA